MGTLSLIMGILQGVTGVAQLFKGSEAADTERPDYTIPKEIYDMLGIAKTAANSQMPDYGLAKSNIEQQGATGMSRARESASSGSDLLGYVSAANVGANKATAGLDATNAQYHSNAQDKLKQALMQMAQFRDKEFNMNEMQPYLDAMRTSSVMTEGGIQNIFGGLSGYANNSMNSKYMDYLMGSGNKKTGISGSGIDEQSLLETLGLNISIPSMNGFGLGSSWGEVKNN